MHIRIHLVMGLQLGLQILVIKAEYGLTLGCSHEPFLYSYNMAVILSYGEKLSTTL